MAKIDLKGKDKAIVLAALFNASKPQGLGFLHYNPKPMSVEEAQKLLKQGTYFDYLQGRVMKIDLSGDTLDTWGYDRDNGEGSAEKAINAAIQTQNVNSVEIQGTHKDATLQSVIDIEGHLCDKSSIECVKGVAVLKLGVDEFAGQLKPKIDAIKSKANKK